MLLAMPSKCCCFQNLTIDQPSPGSTLITHPLGGQKDFVKVQVRLVTFLCKAFPCSPRIETKILQRPSLSAARRSPTPSLSITCPREPTWVSTLFLKCSYLKTVCTCSAPSVPSCGSPLHCHLPTLLKTTPGRGGKQLLKKGGDAQLG